MIGCYFLLTNSRSNIMSSNRNTAQPTDEKAGSSRSFYGSGKFRFAIYPDYWKDSWGKIPLLGHVWADDEFYAVREAYNRKLITVNYTIRPRAVKVPNPTSKW